MSEPHLGVARVEVLDATAPFAPHSRGATGSVRAGLLLTMLDFAGGLCGGLAALPRWVVSTNLVARPRAG